MEFCKLIAGNYLVIREVLVAGSNKLLESSSLEVVVDEEGNVRNPETKVVIDKLEEADCANIYNGAFVAKHFFGNEPSEKFTVILNFKKIKAPK